MRTASLCQGFVHLGHIMYHMKHCARSGAHFALVGFQRSTTAVVAIVVES